MSAGDDESGIGRVRDGDEMTVRLALLLDDAIAIEGGGVLVELVTARKIRLSNGYGDRFELTVVKKR